MKCSLTGPHFGSRRTAAVRGRSLLVLGAVWSTLGVHRDTGSELELPFRYHHRADPKTVLDHRVVTRIRHGDRPRLDGLIRFDDVNKGPIRPVLDGGDRHHQRSFAGA